MEKSSIPKTTLGRIPRYLNHLKELSLERVPYISATTIAKELNLGEVQVRKDLSMVSGTGKPRIGYETETLIAELRKNSMSDINVKVPRTLDARLYLLLREEKMFVTPSEDKSEES